jgi:hypothetical protein
MQPEAIESNIKKLLDRVSELERRVHKLEANSPGHKSPALEAAAAPTFKRNRQKL